MKSDLRLPRNKFFARLWIVFHALAIVPFLVTMLAGKPLNLDADLFNMLPKPNVGKAMGVADERLTEKTAQNVFILVSHDDFSRAKETAEAVYNKIKDSTGFKSVSLYSDMSMLGEMTDFIQKYKWNLLDEAAIEMLNSPGGAEAFAYDALSKVYSAFSFSSLSYLDSDPFMLGDYTLQNYLRVAQESGTAMSPRDGVLATQYEGKWYVMISGILSAEGAALASSTNAIAQIYDACNPLEKDGIRFVYSGTPFHSHESSNSASREITIISCVSFSVVIILCLLIFGTPLPIVCSLVSILISLITAFSVTRFAFGKIHLLTLVFGTSLIGSCIDYSLHYFVNWKANRKLTSGEKIRKHLMTGLLLSLLSTEICYFMLIFAPFNLLKQMATFSITGILSSFLTVVCFYPLLKLPEKKREIKLLKFYRVATGRTKIIAGRVVTIAIFVCTISTMAVLHKNVRIENDLTRLYTMEGRLGDDTILAAKVLQYDPSGWFIISGDNAEDVLVREERVGRDLLAFNAGKEKGGYMATSLFVPSKETQEKSRAASEKLLAIAEEQYEMLGYDASFAADLRADFAASANNFVLPDNSDIPEYLMTAIGTEWLGEIDGKYYSIILPVSVTDEPSYHHIAGDDDNVYFENKMVEMARDLDKLTRTILTLFAVAYVVIFVVLRFFYSWRETFKIVSIPLMIVLVICTVFAVQNNALEFFSITGMILVFGLGLDYVIYMIENDKRKSDSEEAKLEPFAILVSFVTTAVSFGALALSTFMPVHLLGTSIFLGLLTAFICTLF